jgi:hypothetical protein
LARAVSRREDNIPERREKSGRPHPESLSPHEVSDFAGTPKHDSDLPARRGGRLEKRVVLKADGRYLIYYDRP